jgi:hypothetical protein
MRERYHDIATYVRLPMLLPGAVTAWEGQRATVLDVSERTLDGSAASTLPVFIDPYPVCSCHSQPWPCNDAWAEKVAARERLQEQWAADRRCAACGQERNLGPSRYIAGERIRFCRRVGCVAEAERREREWHRDRAREHEQRKQFVAQMTVMTAEQALPLHRTEAGYPRCSTCDGGGCLDCTDPA